MVLYTKYRPQTFADVTGQETIVSTLRRAVQSKRTAHAYIFTGSRGVGKTTLARILAKAVNCEKSEIGDPCLSCTTCLAFTSGSFLDCIEIDAASNTGVDNIRELIETVGFRPIQGQFKVYIIDEVHMLSKGAFNALLKTLEEPPEHVVFILATTDIHKVPATIISRAQRFDFGKLNPDEIFTRLQSVAKAEQFKFSDDTLHLISSHSHGSLRDALTRLEKLTAFGTDVGPAEARSILGVTDKVLQDELIQIIISSNLSEVPNFFDKLNAQSVDSQVLCRDLLESLRGVMSAKLTGENSKTQHSEELNNLSINQIVFLIKLLLKAYKDAPYSPETSLPLLLASIEAAEHFKNISASATTSIGQLFKTAEGLEPQKKNLKSEILIDETKIRTVWDEVLDKMKALNGPLATLLRNSPLLGVEQGSLMLGVKYLFHKEHLESTKNSQIISGVIAEVYGEPLAVHAKIIKEEKKDEKKIAALDALSVFGGEIIEA